MSVTFIWEPIMNGACNKNIYLSQTQSLRLKELVEKETEYIA